MIKRNRSTKLSWAVFLSFAIAASVFAQAGNKKPREVADYKPRTLRELTEMQSAKGENVGDDLIIQGDILPSRVRVVYEGTSRPLQPRKKDLIAHWARRFAGAPEFYTRPYEHEVLFSEGERKFWLPLKKELLPRFEQELKRGDAVDLFIIKLGRVRIGDEWEAVLLAEKFAKP